MEHGCLVQLSVILERVLRYHESTCPLRGQRMDPGRSEVEEAPDLQEAQVALAIRRLRQGGDLWTVARQLGQPPRTLWRCIAAYKRRAPSPSPPGGSA